MRVTKENSFDDDRLGTLTTRFRPSPCRARRTTACPSTVQWNEVVIGLHLPPQPLLPLHSPLDRGLGRFYFVSLWEYPWLLSVNLKPGPTLGDDRLLDVNRITHSEHFVLLLPVFWVSGLGHCPKMRPRPRWRKGFGDFRGTEGDEGYRTDQTLKRGSCRIR